MVVRRDLFRGGLVPDMTTIVGSAEGSGVGGVEDGSIEPVLDDGSLQVW